MATFTILTEPYDIPGFTNGVPAASEVLVRFVAVRALSIPTNCAGSVAKAGVAATASTVFTLAKNGSAVATVTFAISGTTGTFSTQAAIAIASGDIITITAPASPDATLANASITFLATVA